MGETSEKVSMWFVDDPCEKWDKFEILIIKPTFLRQNKINGHFGTILRYNFYAKPTQLKMQINKEN